MRKRIVSYTPVKKRKSKEQIRKEIKALEDMYADNPDIDFIVTNEDPATAKLRKKITDAVNSIDVTGAINIS